jgi:hypothetical protein
MKHANEADLLDHAARCRWLAPALSDEAGRRVLLNLAAECETIAARLKAAQSREPSYDPPGAVAMRECRGRLP